MFELGRRWSHWPGVYILLGQRRRQQGRGFFPGLLLLLDALLHAHVDVLLRVGVPHGRVRVVVLVRLVAQHAVPAGGLYLRRIDGCITQL